MHTSYSPLRPSVPAEDESPLATRLTAGVGRWLRVVAVVLSTSWGMGGGPLPADKTVPATPPLLTVTYASLDRLLADVDDLLAAGDAGVEANRLRTILDFCNNLQGIDRARPLAVMLFISAAGAEPAPLIAVPLSDIVALETTIRTTGNELSTTGDPREFQLQLGQDRLAFTLLGGYGFVTKPEHPVPEGALTAALNQLDRCDPQVDLAVHLLRAGAPPMQLQELQRQLRRDAARELQPKAGETDEDFRLRSDFQAAIFELMELLLNEGEELSAELTLQPRMPTRLDVRLNVTDDGALRDWLRAVLTSPRKLATAADVATAFRLHLALELTGRGRELARRVTSLLRRNMLQELAAGPPDLLDQVVRACDALDATAAAGSLELRLDFLPTPTNKMVLLAAAAVAQPESIDGLLRAALPLAQQSGDLKSVALDAVRLRGINFHEVFGMQVRERDRRLYGDDPALYLAAGRDAVWAVVGSADTAAILAALLQPTETEPLPTSSASLSLRLLPWIELAAAAGSRPATDALPLVRKTISPQATITAELDPTDEGLALSVRADESYVRLLAKLAALRARRR